MKPMDRITAIELSLRIFVCGMLSLCPFLGIFPAAAAVVGYFQLRRGYPDVNPANRYAEGGAWLAVLGLVITLVVASLIGFSAVSHAGGYGAHGGIYE
jgi:hypothetical protein